MTRSAPLGAPTVILLGFVSDWTSDSHFTHYLPRKMKSIWCGLKLQSVHIHYIYHPIQLQSTNSLLIMILHIYLEISCSFGQMMQVFPPRPLLVLIRIPLRFHQIIACCFIVSLSQAFLIPFDLNNNKCLCLFQYFHCCSLAPL